MNEDIIVSQSPALPLNSLQKMIFECCWPLNSIFITTDSANPNTLLTGGDGSVWEKIQNRFLLGSGSKNVGVTGGEETVTLTIATMPNHTHPTGYTNDNDGNWSFGRPNSIIWATDENNTRGNVSTTYGVIADSSATPWVSGVNGTFGDRGANEYVDGGINGYCGESQPHNNMPPYVVVNIWKRVS